MNRKKERGATIDQEDHIKCIVIDQCDEKDIFCGASGFTSLLVTLFYSNPFLHL